MTVFFTITQDNGEAFIHHVLEQCFSSYGDYMFQHLVYTVTADRASFCHQQISYIVSNNGASVMTFLFVKLEKRLDENVNFQAL